MKTGGSEWQVGVMTRKTKGRMGIVTWKVVQKKKFLFDGAEKENEEKIMGHGRKTQLSKTNKENGGKSKTERE